MSEINFYAGAAGGDPELNTLLLRLHTESSPPLAKVSAVARAALVEHLDQQAGVQADHGRDIRAVHLETFYPPDTRSVTG